MTYFDDRRDRLDAFRRGDRAVLAEVFEVYVDAVTQVLQCGFRIEHKQLTVRGIDDVEKEQELTQEVFLRAFSEKARLGFDGLRPYRPYLLQITRNLMIDEARRAGLIQAIVSASELEDVASLEPSADEVLEWRRLSEATAEYCRGLNAQLAEIVRLRFDLGLSQRDVAKQMNVSRRQVRTWEEAVRDGLTEFLESRGPSAPSTVLKEGAS